MCACVCRCRQLPGLVPLPQAKARTHGFRSVAAARARARLSLQSLCCRPGAQGIGTVTQPQWDTGTNHLLYLIDIVHPLGYILAAFSKHAVSDWSVIIYFTRYLSVRRKYWLLAMLHASLSTSICLETIVFGATYVDKPSVAIFNREDEMKYEIQQKNYCYILTKT